MSRPRGSGFAVSKSMREFASSMGSDFLYPTAFMPVVSLRWCSLLWRNCRSSAILARASPLSFLKEQEQPRLLLDWQDRLERHLGPHRKCIELRARIAEIGRAHLLGNVAVQVVEQESDVAVGVPV